MKIKYMKQERILIEMSGEKQLELCNNVYQIGDSYELDGETYTSIDKIDKSHDSIGESWDYIVQRKSDGLYFSFNVWDDGEYEGGWNARWICQDKGLEQVFQTTKITYE